MLYKANSKDIENLFITAEVESLEGKVFFYDDYNTLGVIPQETSFHYTDDIFGGTAENGSKSGNWLCVGQSSLINPNSWICMGAASAFIDHTDNKVYITDPYGGDVYIRVWHTNLEVE